MRRPLTLLRRNVGPACLYRSIRCISSAPPLINIQNGTFYHRFPTYDARNQPDTPPLFPNLSFVLPSTSVPAEKTKDSQELQHWGIIGSSGRTTFLQTLRGQHVVVPPRARSFPYLASDEYTGKNRSPGRAIRYVGFADDGQQGQANPRGAYLSARYESRREDTDFTLLDYLKGRTSLNPMEGEEDGTLHNNALLDEVIASLNLEKLVELPVANLSNGQTRRARIAKALLWDPEVLLVDEPFMGLDPSTQKHLSSLLHSLAAKSSPRLILSLRPQDEIPDWLTHLVVLGKDNHVSFQGEKKEVLRQVHMCRHLPWRRVTVKKGAMKSSAFMQTVPDNPRNVAKKKLVLDKKDAGINSAHKLKSQFLHREREMYEGLSPEDKAIYNRAEMQFEQGVLDSNLIRDLTKPGVKPVGSNPVEIGEPVVEMEGVQVKYGDDVVLGDWKQNINNEEKPGLFWKVRRGERWGVFGPNGSGKTTLLSLITSDHPQAYSLPLKIFGHSRLPTPGKPGVSIFDLQSRIGHSSPEIHSFFPRYLSVRQSVESAYADTFLAKPRLDHERDVDTDAAISFFEEELNSNFLPWFEQSQHPRLDPKELEEQSEEDTVLLSTLRKAYSTKRINIPHDPRRLDWADNITFGELSVPQQRIVLFIRAVVHKPDLIVLDEAFSGMSPSARDRCLHFLRFGERYSSDGIGSNPALSRSTYIKAMEEFRHQGLTADQALITISHVKEEIPGMVRNWMYLPTPDQEKSEANTFRTGTLNESEYIATNAWNKVWDPTAPEPDSLEGLGSQEDEWMLDEISEDMLKEMPGRMPGGTGTRADTRGAKGEAKSKKREARGKIR